MAHPRRRDLREVDVYSERCPIQKDVVIRV